MRRRRFLTATGTATLVGLAGCAGDDGGDENGGETTDRSATDGDQSESTDSGGNGDDSTPMDDGTDTSTPTDERETGGETRTVENVQLVDTLETTPGDQPSYATWFGPKQVVQLDFERARRADAYAQRFRELEESDQSQDPATEPLFPFADTVAEGLPANSSAGLLLLVGFASMSYPFLQGVEFPGGEPAADPVMSANRVMNTGDVVVLGGEVATETLVGREDVTETGSASGFTRYESGGGGQAAPFAADDQRLVIASNNAQDGRSAQAILETALETASSGVTVDDADFSWLLDQCGDGAFVLGADDEDTPGGNQGLTGSDIEYNIAEATLQSFERLLDDATSQLLVADVVDGTRVTRSGIAFESASAVPDEGDLANLVAGGAGRANVLVEGNRAAVEAFFEA